MAIEFARAKAISRGKGGNVCRTAAYNARAKITDQTTGTRYNFTHREGNLYHEIVLPIYANDRFKDLSTLMNEVEKHNDRKNSQLAREIVLALPDNLEITLDDRIELTRRFIDEMGFTAGGLGVVFDIHAPDAEDKNNHAHLIVLDQHRFKEDGLGFYDFKARDLQPNFRYNKILARAEKLPGKVWRKIQNDYFIEKGLNIRVDDISTIPYEHIGPVRMRNILNQAITRNEIRAIGHLETIKDAGGALKTITRNQAVFTKADIERALKKIEDPLLRKKIIEQVLSSDQLILLQAPRSVSIISQEQEPSSTPLYFTTKDIRNEEERLFRFACKVRALPNMCANPRIIRSFSRFNAECDLNGCLSEAQLTTLKNLLTSEGGVRVFRGRAGTGKSHLLGFASYLSEEEGINVIGLAPTHKAVLELQANGFKTSDTLKGFLFKLYNGQTLLPHSSLIILDEAGMVDTESYLELFKIAKAKDCNIILAGDELQLTSVSRGGMFEVFADKFGSFELSEIRRQDEAWAKELASSFATGNIRAGIKLLKEHKGLCHTDTLSHSMIKLVEDFTSREQDLVNMLAITLRNKEVNALNESIREVLKAQGRLLGPEYQITKAQEQTGLTKEQVVQTSKGYMKGDRIVFGTTPKDLPAKNGDFATLTFASKDKFIAKLDNAGTEVTFDPREMHNFKHGYASTTYKAQGSSIKHVYVLHNGIGSSRSSYVAMTRFVESIKLYTNNDATKSVSDLITQLSLKDEKSASLSFMTRAEVDLLLQKGDYADLNNSPNNPSNANRTTIQKLGSWLKEQATNIGDRLHSNHGYYSFEAETIMPAKVEEVLAQTAAEVMSRREDIATSRPNINEIASKHPDTAEADDKASGSTRHEVYENGAAEPATSALPIQAQPIQEMLASILPNLLQYQDKLGSEEYINYMEHQASRSKSESSHEFLSYGSPLYQTLLASILMNKNSKPNPLNGIKLAPKLQDEQKVATNVDTKLIMQAQDSFESKIQSFHGDDNSNYQHFEDKLSSLNVSNKVDIYRTLVRDVSLIHREQLASIALKLPAVHVELIAQTIYSIINSYRTQNGRGQNPLMLTNRDMEQIATKAYETLCKGDWWNNEIMKKIELEKYLTTKTNTQLDIYGIKGDVRRTHSQVEREHQIAVGETTHSAQNSIATNSQFQTIHAESSRYNPQSSATKNNFTYLNDTEALRSKMSLGAEFIAKNLLGEPNKHLSNGKTLRFGESGKLALQISGSKSGIWYDFSESKGGDLFELVSRERNCSFTEAKDYIKSVIGIPNNITYLRSQDTDALYKQRQAEDQKQKTADTNKIQKATQLYNKAQPLGADSIAARYLKNHRKIQNINNSSCSPDLKTSELWSIETKTKIPALIAFARSQDNKITGGQQIYLNKETAEKADLKEDKRSFGKIAGSFVVIQDTGDAASGASNITIIAEGLETALSLQEASIKGKILCSLGVSNIQNYSALKGEKIMIAADNDGKDAASLRSIMNAREILEEKGAVVSVTMPKEPGDWNDVLKEQGTRAIQDQLNPGLIKLLKDDGLDRMIEKITVLATDSLSTSADDFIKNLSALKTLAPNILEDILTTSKALGIDGCIEQATTQLKNIKIQKQQEFNQFIKYHQSMLQEIASLDSNINIQTLIEDLKEQCSHLSPKEASKLYTTHLELLWTQIFKDKVVPELNAINKALNTAKTPAQLLKAMDLEKELYSNLRTKYNRLSKAVLSKEQHEKLLHNVVFHKDNPNFIANITKDIEILTKNQIWPEEKIMQIMHDTQNNGHYLNMEHELFKPCKNHIEQEVMQDLNRIDLNHINPSNHQPLERDNIIFTDHKTYLEYRINDKDLGHYLTNTEPHKLLDQIHKDEHKHRQEEQRQKQLQKEQAAMEQLEMHKETDRGFDKGM